MFSVLTPEYVMRELGEAQRLLDERRPILDTQLATLEQDVAEAEVAVRGLLQLIQKQGLTPLFGR